MYTAVAQRHGMSIRAIEDEEMYSHCLAFVLGLYADWYIALLESPLSQWERPETRAAHLADVRWAIDEVLAECLRWELSHK